MWIKICANTNLADALAAADAGADAIGFVFASSPRRILPETAGAITEQVPPFVEKIGVFQNEPLPSLLAAVEQAHLTGAQLHGSESTEYVKELRRERPTLKIIKGLSPGESASGFMSDFILVDSGPAGSRGGTGKTFDWSAYAASLRQISQPVILAGGLTPENVAEAIRILHPFGVDVASGVEATRGMKDHTKLRAFIAAVHAARQ
jgi:phosphoribosylanthranilate isomerase